MRGLQLRKAAELPRYMMHARLCCLRGLPSGQLEQRQLVVFRAEAEKDHATLAIFIRHLQPQHPGIKVFRLLRVPYFQHDMPKLPCLNHARPPGARAPYVRWTTKTNLTTCQILS